MYEIPCKHGRILIDDGDIGRVTKYKWSSYYSGRLGHCYALTRVKRNGKRVNLLLHRFIMDAQPGQQVDHANNDGLDNRRENLRFCSTWQNSMNRAKDGSAGVTFSTRHKTHPWKSKIQYHGKAYILGYYKTKEEAAAAHDGAARILAAEFAAMNVGLP